jgi:hypothetical protein
MRKKHVVGGSRFAVVRLLINMINTRPLHGRYRTNSTCAEIMQKLLLKELLRKNGELLREKLLKLLTRFQKQGIRYISFCFDLCILAVSI